MENEKVMLVISQNNDNGKLLFRVANEFGINIPIMCGIFYGLYSTLINAIPEEEQIEVEREFLKMFLSNFNDSWKYLDIYEQNVNE